MADDPALLPLPSLALNSPTLTSPSTPPLSPPRSAPTTPTPRQRSPIQFRRYRGEEDVAHIMELVDTELSEPYNFYTYRYFLSDWPNLCFMAYDGELPVGTIVCKQDVHRDKLNRGYLAMLSTRPSHRGHGIATKLARLAIQEMVSQGCQEVVLETESDNEAALRFYTKLGFIKEKRLFRFYMNAKDAFRLFLPLPESLTSSVKRDVEEKDLEDGVEER